MIAILSLLSLVAGFSILICAENRELFLRINRIFFLTGGELWANVTVLGDTLVASLVLMLFLRRKPELVWAAICTGAIGGIAVQSVKAIVCEPRPLSVYAEGTIGHIGPHLHSFSFPSGHTATAFALAALLAWAYPHWYARIAFFAYAILVGISRVVVGVHWPVDVAFGAFFGLVSAWLGVFIAQKYPAGSSPIVMKTAGLLLLAGAACCVFLEAAGYTEGMPAQRFIGSAAIVFGGREFASLWR